MVLTSAIAHIFEPTEYIASTKNQIALQSNIPTQFGAWSELKQGSAQIIDPIQSEVLKKTYTEILTRTYGNSSGNRVMLSIAYGKDQRSDTAVHYPEVCYPAQGFAIKSNKIATLNLKSEAITARQLETTLGNQRPEPVTYWTTIGDYRSLGGFEKRLIELKYGARGQIPDGLIFRVSSIGTNSDAQFKMQTEFISDLLEAVRNDYKARLIGTKTF
jgi:EpsI family protein